MTTTGIPLFNNENSYVGGSICKIIMFDDKITGHTTTILKSHFSYQSNKWITDISTF